MIVYVVTEESYQSRIVYGVFKDFKKVEKFCADRNADLTRKSIFSFQEFEIE